MEGRVLGGDMSEFSSSCDSSSGTSVVQSLLLLPGRKLSVQWWFLSAWSVRSDFQHARI